MKNCTNCGTARTGSNQFCLNCGTKFEVASTSVPTVKETKQPTPKKRKTKITGILALAVILLAAAGAHLFLQSKYDASKSLVAMNQAFSKNDAEEFISFFTIPEKVTVDEKAFYAFVKNEGWGNLRSQLKAETEGLKNGELSDIILDSKGNNLFSVVHEPVVFGLYDKISFLIHPVAVETEMPFDKTSIAIGTKTISGNQGEQVPVGEFLPGSYESTTSVESEFSPLTTKGAIEIQGDGNNSYLLESDLEGGMLSITSDVGDAVLWINGKSTEKTVREMSRIGPLAFDGSVEISAESKDEKGQIIKGDPVIIESDTVHITFPAVQEKLTADREKKMEEESLQNLLGLHESMLHELISAFRYDFESALNYADFSYISSYFPIASPIEAEYIAKMEKHENLDEYYEYDFRSTTVAGLQVIDEQTFQLTTDEIFYYTLGETEYDYNKTKMYTIELQSGGGYFITAIEELTNNFDEV